MSMGKKKFRLICVLGLCLTLLAGCAARKPEAPVSGQAVTLPAPEIPWEAPNTDWVSGEEEIWTLYLPGKNGLNLVAQHIAAVPDTLRAEKMELLVRELLSYPSNQQVDALGGGTELTLFGENPVEFSGGVATVNLGSSALGLTYRDFYTLSLALASTLCEMDAVRCVNVLVAGRSVSLDTTGSLAMGSLVAHPGENLPVLWEQMEAKRPPVGQNAAATPLTSYVTLYFPLENGQGISCENRTMTFPGQTPQQMTGTILENLSHGALYLTGVPDMPDLPGMLAHEPLSTELTDGGRMITLSFREGADQTWEEAGVDPACLAAAICCSLTTFIPGLAGVAIRIGDSPLTTLSSEKFETVTVLGGLFRRERFESFLMGRTTVYLARGGRLVPVEKSISRELADSPREQLAALFDGPGAGERAEGLEPTLPVLVGPEDVLGIAQEGDTMLVNLSESFRAEIQSWGREGETLLCYSIVNTLCENSGARRVCFFFEGEQLETIAGDLCWDGWFDMNTGLCEESYG